MFLFVLFVQGGIFLDEDARVINSNILTSDGVLHISDNLLIPDDIQPLLPRFCNRKIFSRVSFQVTDCQGWLAAIWHI